METVAAALRERVLAAEPRLRAMREEPISCKPSLDEWSKKEILGHLIDSACNNHQRFVRGQLEEEMVFPGYEQEGWVRCQGYADSEWPLLIDLWASYNLHLAAVIARLSEDRLSTACRIGGGEPLTLAWIAEDYIRHLDHHLAQLLKADEVEPFTPRTPERDCQ